MTQAILHKTLIAKLLTNGSMSRPEKSLPKNGNFYAT